MGLSAFVGCMIQQYPNLQYRKDFAHYLQLYLYILQVIAFSDEEGVRFQSTFLGSAAIAGTLPASALQFSDKRFLE